MANQNHVNASLNAAPAPATLTSANSVNGNTVPIDGGALLPHVAATASASENELSALATGRFLVAKNSMELHKKKVKLERHNQSLPSVFEPEHYCKAANVKSHEHEHEHEPMAAAMAAAMNSNHLPGESSLLSLKKTNGAKKKVEWADLHRGHAKQLAASKVFEYDDKMDTSDSEVSDLETEWVSVKQENYAASDSEAEPLVSILDPLPAQVISQDSQTPLSSDTELMPDTSVNDLVHNISKVSITGSPKPQLDTPSEILGSYERPYPNPFDKTAQSLHLAQSHMQSNYTTLRTSEAQLSLQDYYTPRNTVPDLVAVQADKKLAGADANCPSPLIGQYCPFPRETNATEYPPPSFQNPNPEKMEAVYEDSIVDFGRPPPDDDDTENVNQNQSPVQIMPDAAPPSSNDDDDELLEPEKKVEIRLPSIDELWVPTVANVAAITPREQHHLIEVNYKKDCRTWLWKSARQREERYRKLNNSSSS